MVDLECLEWQNAELTRVANHASLDVFDMPYRTKPLLDLIRRTQVPTQTLNPYATVSSARRGRCNSPCTVATCRVRPVSVGAVEALSGV